MSEHDSWLAIRGPGSDEVLKILGLEETGEVGWYRDVGQPYSYASMPGRWTIVFANFNGLADIENLRDLSRRGLVLSCDFQDQVEAPSSVLIAARDGEKLWEIGVVGDDVSATGTLPPEFGPIRDHYAAQSAEDDSVAWMYEVPFELAKALCGFRHNEDDTPFMGLRPRPGSRWHADLKMADHPSSPSEPIGWKARAEKIAVRFGFGMLILVLLVRIVAYVLG